jgi:hypothetical protein
MYINVYLPTESPIEARHVVHNAFRASHCYYSHLTKPNFSDTSINTK